MENALRPYATTGMAIAGAALIAVAPVTPVTPQEHTPYIRQHTVELAAFDPITEYSALFTDTTNNLQALFANIPDFFGALSYIFSNFDETIRHIPDVVSLLIGILPEFGFGGLPLPLDFSVGLPIWAEMLISQLGPWANVFSAAQELFAAIFDFSDPVGALNALLSAPAVLLNAFLNGTTSFDLGGIGLTVFHGILSQGGPLSANLDLGSLLNLGDFGDKTLGDLLEESGIGDRPLTDVLTGLLDSAGVGDLTPVDLLNQTPVGQEPLADLLVSLLDSSGAVDTNSSIADLLADLGLDDDTSVADLLKQLLSLGGFDDPTLTDLLDELDLGDATLGSIVKELLESQGLDGSTLADLIGPDVTLGGLLDDLLGDQTAADLFGMLGIGGMSLSELVAQALGDSGTQTLLDLIDDGAFGEDIDSSTPLFDLFGGLLEPGMTIGDLLTDGDEPAGDMTLGELLDGMPVGENDFGIPEDATFATMKFTDLLTFAGVGDKHLSELTDNDKVGKIGDPTLNSLMGNNSVLETLTNLGQGPNLPDGLAGLTLTQLLGALPGDVGNGPTPLTDIELSDLLGALGDASGNVTLGDFFTDVGFNPDLSTLTNNLLGGLGLGNTTIDDLADDWGLNNVPATNLIDALGLNGIHVRDLLDDLNLNNLDLDTIINRLGLDDIGLTTLLGSLGLDDVHLNDILDNLLGDVQVGDVLDDLGLDDVTLAEFITGIDLLNATTLSSLLTGLGLDSNDLNTIIDGLGLDDVTLSSILGDLGVDDVTLGDILDGLGLSDLDVVGLNVGDFTGMLPELFNHLPQQILNALGVP